ncbi:hypothetical protein SPONN_562 [uncultured Candidatus Thioglobus sp.]|nr:hypothetical protein SPONN_562 [uncultured Candidatus Thioglobus sp.]
MEAITIQQDTFNELNFYKKLIENNLQEDLSMDEINQIKQAKTTSLLSKNEFLKNHPELKNLPRSQVPAW